jgi:hypothetical protein
LLDQAECVRRIVAGLEDRYWDDVPHALAHEASVGVAPRA